jgi:hypothetical protein
MNDESKVRRSTKSVIPGKAKVTSYDDLKEAREKRPEQEATGKGKRGRKSAAPKAEGSAVGSAKVP